VVLGEGAIKLGLEHGGVLPGFSEFFLQSFRPNYCIAIPLEHVRLFVGISPRHPAQGNNSYLGTRSVGTRLLKSTDTYIHPLLGTPHRFQVAGYCRRADKVIR
jgi:hypothetical protein